MTASEQGGRGLFLPRLHRRCCGDAAYGCTGKTLGRTVTFLELAGPVEEVVFSAGWDQWLLVSGSPDLPVEWVPNKAESAVLTGCLDD